ncbi:hypothetical protein YPPY14_3030, partial [Yersinia pestis PY-14]|uniref:hypothetical protein n=2 Tax=Yersinia pestis TaxID=632 RepID=UPI000267C47E
SSKEPKVVEKNQKPQAIDWLDYYSHANLLSELSTVIGLLFSPKLAYFLNTPKASGKGSCVLQPKK